MDTICLCKAFGEEDDLAPNYKSLLTTDPPIGCTTWLKGIPGSDLICLWVKINCHELLGVQNLDAPDIERLTAAVTDWLGLAGLTVMI